MHLFRSAVITQFLFGVCRFHAEQKNQHGTITETKQTTLESQLQTEREALERKEKEVGHRCTVTHVFQTQIKRQKNI